MKEMSKINQIKICDRVIGKNQIPLVIPEIGINHGGNFEKAKKMIKDAHDSGAECVKFQSHVIDDEMIKNNIIPQSFFYKIIYSNNFITLNGLYILFELKNYSLNKEKIYFSKAMIK